MASQVTATITLNDTLDGGSSTKIEVKNLEKIKIVSGAKFYEDITDFKNFFVHPAYEFSFQGETTVSVCGKDIKFVEFC